MSELKSVIKMETAHQIGSRLDDQLDAANAEVQKYDGAKEALRQATKAVEALLSHVDKDISEGKYDAFDEPLKVAEMVKLYVKRAAGAVENLSVGAEVTALKARGKVEALQTAVKAAKDVFDTEAAKRERIREAMEQGALVEEDGARPEAVRPSLGDAAADIAARRAEARAARAGLPENPPPAPESSASDSGAQQVDAGGNGHTKTGRGRVRKK